MKPKINKPNINISRNNKLKKRELEWIKNFDENTSGLPQRIKLEDLDGVFTNFIKDETPPLRSPKSDGEFQKILHFFMVNEKWSEFSRTWTITDDNGNILKPYGIIRRINDTKGTLYSDKYNVPKREGFTYMKIPTLGNDKTLIGYDIFKIPQFSTVDLTFRYTLLTKNFLDINTMDEFFYESFNKLQKYVNHQGHYFPITYLNNEDDVNDGIMESNDYIKNYDFLMKAYIVNPESFEKVRSIKRTITTTRFD